MVKLERIPRPDPDRILAAFLHHLDCSGIEADPYQEEAILELYQGRNVILQTPTGSGKSLVAHALQYLALCSDRRSFYTTPIKALANEKFFGLCELFGPEWVGLLTGDATVNPGAHVICCTAEILANLGLRRGKRAPVDCAILDEFHYYADPARGTAWQVPLLTLPQSQFLLLSATLGETGFFARELTRLTGRSTAVIESEERPVPLEFSYSETPLQEEVASLLERDRAPIYLVHFTQLACSRTAQSLLSLRVSGRSERREIERILKGADFHSPYGKTLRRFLRHGLAVHHAGLLPKYRHLVETLAQRGLLKVICGTDTLGVGINVPIRTVLFTQLCKYDGTDTKLLGVREFQQISGRAGRRGFDAVGTVVVQAPEHVIENRRLERKASEAAGKKRFVRKKPPVRGFIAWDEATFERLCRSPPEKLRSSFRLHPGMLLQVLSRTGEDGCAAFRELLNRCHEPPARRIRLKREAFHLFRGLVEGGIVRMLPPGERAGPEKVRLDVDLQEDFTLTHALELYLLDALRALDAEDPDYGLRVLSLVEAVVENPRVILRRQEERIKSELLAEMKAAGISYEARMERLEEVEYPQPDADSIRDSFDDFCDRHLWISRERISPKSIARDMIEQGQSFDEYVKAYQLERSEGVLLRHLSDVCRLLRHTVPPAAVTNDVSRAREVLEAVVRGIDSSLLDEWEALQSRSTEG